jgi:hypothetical protein
VCRFDFRSSRCFLSFFFLVLLCFFLYIFVQFGMCSKCKASEGRILKVAGAVANPGGAGGCPKGGKHMFKVRLGTKAFNTGAMTEHQFDDTV